MPCTQGTPAPTRTRTPRSARPGTRALLVVFKRRWSHTMPTDAAPRRPPSPEAGSACCPRRFAAVASGRHLGFGRPCVEPSGCVASRLCVGHPERHHSNHGPCGAVPLLLGRQGCPCAAPASGADGTPRKAAALPVHLGRTAVRVLGAVPARRARDLVGPRRRQSHAGPRCRPVCPSQAYTYGRCPRRLPAATRAAKILDS